MIWFRNPPAALSPLPGAQLSVYGRMRQALESVASTRPHLSGHALVDALTETGWVDRTTAGRLLPEFAHFDLERHFAAHVRSLSFRGTGMLGEFRAAVERMVQDLVGAGARMPVGPDEGIVFEREEQQGIVLAYPEVGFSIGGRVRDTIMSAAEEMPDMVVLVARNFDPHAPQQLASLLSGTDVPGTLLTVNLLLGLRAMSLKYQPPVACVLELLGRGGLLRSPAIAVLGDRSARPVSV
jgi:hypothetical protein